MKTLLLLLVLASTANAQKYQVEDHPQPFFAQGVREGFEMVNFHTRYNWIQASPPNINIKMRANLPQGALAIADSTGVYGPPNTIYVDPTRDTVDVHQVRVLIAHEVGHLLGAVHTGGMDVMNINIVPVKDFSPSDLNQLPYRLDTTPQGNPPWIRRKWNNGKDVDGNGKVTTRDALLILNFLNSGGQYHWRTIPKYRYDVNNSGSITSSDALIIINSLK